MRILYPENPLNPSEADTPYREECMAMIAQGFPCSLFDFDSLAFGEFQPHPSIEVNERILYRGWMLNSQTYQTLITQIKRKGGTPITSHSDYLQCHYLPNWYPQCAAFTAETHFFEATPTLLSQINDLGWEQFFVKDFVKSNTAEKGSIAHSPSDVCEIVKQIATYRGEIEGGISIRRVENYVSDTEHRFFVVQGIPYAPDGDPPGLVQTIANLIKAPFYSVDLIQNLAGEWRLVELGDGQVSDKKAWPMSTFIDVLKANADPKQTYTRNPKDQGR